MMRLKTAATGVVALTLVIGVISIHTARAGKADDDKDKNESDVRTGLAISPVPLKLHGKNRALVARGSYLVNAVGDCDGCHTGDPEYAPGGDPFMGEPKKVNAATYLQGGSSMFGPFVPRNLTPDLTGKPEGGASFEEFRRTMRTGIDPDQAHPQFGPYLQVMPWPNFQNMTDYDLRAIYEYLSAIPCIEGDPGLPNPRPIGTRCQ